MRVSAPKKQETIQRVEESTQDLHQAVSGYLNQAGHRVTPQSVNPADQSPLEKIEVALGDVTGDVAHVVESGFEEHVAGAGDAAHVRTTEGKTPILIAARRLVQKGREFLGKAA